MAMMSTARLIEKMKRLGPSSGSHGSLAPVSPLAQPPSRAAAATAATAEWRTAATVFRTPSTMDTGCSQKRLCFAAVGASVAHAACTLKRLRRPRLNLVPCEHKDMLIYITDGKPFNPVAGGGGGHAAAYPGAGGARGPDRQRLRACAGAEPAAGVAASQAAGRGRAARALQGGAVHPLPAGDRRRRCRAGARVRPS